MSVHMTHFIKQEQKQLEVSDNWNVSLNTAKSESTATENVNFL